MIRLGIIENNHLHSRSYAEFFEALSDYYISLQVSSVKELQQDKLPFLSIDVFIVDLPIAETREVEIVSLLKKEVPKARVIFFTTRTEILFIIDAFKNGADGYLLKTEGLFELHQAIKTVLNDGLVISPTVARQVIQYIFSEKIPDMPAKFTSREKEILHLVQEGLSYKEMADELKVTPFTINHHLKKIYKKGGVNSRSQLMVLLQKHATIG